MSATTQTPISNRGLPAQFLCTPLYYHPLHLAGVTASIDNVRMKFVYAKSAFDFTANKHIDTIETLLNELTSVALFMEGELDHQYTSSNFRVGNYAHTITYKLTEGRSFAVLVGRYDYKESNRQIAAEAVIDYNPNKVPAKAWQRITGILAARAINSHVVRFDLAFDFPILRNNLRLVQRPGSQYHLLSDEQYTITEYTGQRSHHAAVKLYDKAAELQLPNPCTRLEITIERSRFKTLQQLMPDIISLAPLELSLAFDELPPIVQAIIIHPDLYDRMRRSVSRNTWAKFKSILEDYKPGDSGFFFTLPDDQITQIESYVRSYIAELPSAHLRPEVIT